MQHVVTIHPFCCVPDELLATHLSHFLVLPGATCRSTDKVQYLFCGVSAAKDSGGQVMPNDRLPKQLLFGQVKGSMPTRLLQV